jgi:hypothetical protein
MHSKNIILVEAPAGKVSDEKITRLVEIGMERHSSRFDYYLIGGRWPKSVNGKNILPIASLTQEHLDGSNSIIAGGYWFERTIYRPWLPIGEGEGQMFERKKAEEMPGADWIQKEFKTVETDEYSYQYFAVVVDCHA